MSENLSGPGNGGTINPSVNDVEKHAIDVARKGAGAFPRYNENPPNNGPPSPDANYYPLKRKMSKKRMKKK